MFSCSSVHACLPTFDPTLHLGVYSLHSDDLLLSCAKLLYVDLFLAKHSGQKQRDDVGSNVEFSKGSQSIPIQESLSLPRMNSSHMSPVFQAIGSFMRGDARATLCHMREFLQQQVGCYSQDNVLELEPVCLPQCTFSGLDMNHLLDPAICPSTEKTIFLRLLIGLSYRQTQNHAQTQWLKNLTSPVENVFCTAQLYGDFKTAQQQGVCRALLVGLDQWTLSPREYHRQQALLHDTLGILQAKDPREVNILVRLQGKKEEHDIARHIRENLVRQAGCDCQDRVLMQLDSYTSLQSAGYARAAISCKDASLSPSDRIALAKEAEGIHSDSMAEQQLLLNVLGIPPAISGHTPGMLSARFDNMLRGLRIQQLSQLLFPSSATHQNEMLHHVDTQMKVIADGFEQIPRHCLDDNIIALKEGMLSIIDFLNAQIETGIIQGFALDNPYIPE